MPTARDVLSDKGNQVHTTTPGATVLDAINKMNQHKIGALVVTDGGKVVGIFTERDVLRRVAGERKDPSRTFVKDVMTADVICCAPETDLEQVSAVMRERRIRHLPVCGPDKTGLAGLISIGDVNAWHANDQQAQIHYLSEYIYGRA